MLVRGSASKKLLISLNIMAALAVISLAAKFLVAPIAATYFWGVKYKELVFECDNVMRSHFIAKTKVQNRPSEENLQGLRAAEVSLLACHDYDKLRKKLERFGVTDAALASLGLEAIEERAKDVREFVETHEIRY